MKFNVSENFHEIPSLSIEKTENMRLSFRYKFESVWVEVLVLLARKYRIYSIRNVVFHIFVDKNVHHRTQNCADKIITHIQLYSSLRFVADVNKKAVIWHWENRISFKISNLKVVYRIRLNILVKSHQLSKLVVAGKTLSWYWCKIYV